MKGTNYSLMVLFLFCFLWSVAKGQSYMIEPPGKLGGGPSEIAPCGNGTEYVGYLEVAIGEYFTVSWTPLPEEEQSNDLVYLSLLDADTEEIVLSVANISFNTHTRQVRIPFEAIPGSYLFQWSWTTYYTCSRLNLSEAEVSVTPIELDAPYADSLKTETFDYYELELIGQENNGDFLLIEATGPSASTTENSYLIVVAKEGFDYYPNLIEFDEKASTLEYDQVVMGLCRDNNNEDEFQFGVIGSPQSAGEAYTLRVTAYDPTFGVETPMESSPHNGYKYYRTGSRSRAGTKRRVVVTSSSPFEEVPQISLSEDCDFDEDVLPATQISETKSCILLPDDDDDDYLVVPPQVNSYQINVEEGNCEEIADSSSTLAISFFLIASLLLLFI